MFDVLCLCAGRLIFFLGGSLLAVTLLFLMIEFTLEKLGLIKMVIDAMWHVAKSKRKDRRAPGC